MMNVLKFGAFIGLLKFSIANPCLGLYDNTNYGGDNCGLSDYNFGQCYDINQIFNDRMSSWLFVNEDSNNFYQVTFYENTECTGEYYSYQLNVPQKDCYNGKNGAKGVGWIGDAFNDKTSSFMVENHWRPGNPLQIGNSNGVGGIPGSMAGCDCNAKNWQSCP
jgi:hypothetical protein